MGMCVNMLSHIQLFVTLWTCSAPPDFSVHGILLQEYWRGLPFPPSGDLPDPVIEPMSPESPTFSVRFFTVEPPGKRLLWD